VRELWYKDDEAGHAQAEAFARREDRPGRSVFDAVNLFYDNATSRNGEFVAALRCIHLDVDLKDVIETKNDALKRILSLAYKPSKIVDSGHGLHVYWVFKEPIEMGDREAAAARELRTQLTAYLHADRQVDHDAALMRRPGTTNSKAIEQPVPCTVMWEDRHATL
jgi:hypothetical protein